MLQKQTVDAATLELLNELMADEQLNNFLLVGGTALALQIGHRKSIDLDLFTIDSFNENEVSEYLESSRKFKTDFISKNTAKGEISGIKVDLIKHGYPLVNPPLIVEGIRMASIEDIAAMKLNAIIGNGTRLKDFVDIAYCSYRICLNQMLAAYDKKYKVRNPVMAIKALSYFEDINHKEPINLLNENLKWPLVEERLKNMIKYPLQTFPSLLMEIKTENKLGRKR